MCKTLIFKEIKLFQSKMTKKIKPQKMHERRGKRGRAAAGPKLLSILFHLYYLFSCLYEQFCNELSTKNEQLVPIFLKFRVYYKLRTPYAFGLPFHTFLH